MRSRPNFIFLFFSGFILLVDLVVFVGLTLDFPLLLKPSGVVAFWTVPILFILALVWFGRLYMSRDKPGYPSNFFLLTSFFLVVYFPKLIFLTFFLIENILIAGVFAVLKILAQPGNFSVFHSQTFLNNITLFILPIAVIVFITLIGGILFGRFNFKVRELLTEHPDLPDKFNGFRIIHISDIHLGSLSGHQDKIKRAIELINQADADLILFTGDLVNDVAEETRGWTELLHEMKSSTGKFAILGNHDYGEYYGWPDEAAWKANMEQLMVAHEDAGFSLLLNASKKIVRGEDEICILGVENWGLPPFKQYGDLEKAMKDTGENGFRILMSHDPSHWDEEVLGKTNIQLTLSGHTHGFQFGIRRPRFKWSPVQIKYPRWIGLYQLGHQILHINPGLGYIGYAGRIGIPPEITVITLKKST